MNNIMQTRENTIIIKTKKKLPRRKQNIMQKTKENCNITTKTRTVSKKLNIIDREENTPKNSSMI